MDCAKREDVLMLDDFPTQKSIMLEVYAKAFHQLVAPGLYQSEPDLIVCIIGV